MSVQLGSVIGNNIYRADDSPKYRRGNSVLLALNLLGIVVFIGTKVYYVSRNRYSDRIWAAMTEEVSLTLTLSSETYTEEVADRIFYSNGWIIREILLIPGARGWTFGLLIKVFDEYGNWTQMTEMAWS